MGYLKRGVEALLAVRGGIDGVARGAQFGLQ